MRAQLLAPGKFLALRITLCLPPQTGHSRLLVECSDARKDGQNFAGFFEFGCDRSLRTNQLPVAKPHRL
jgi:hypothetical protein